MNLSFEIILYIFGFICLFLLIWVIRLEMKIKKILNGRGMSIEDALNSLNKDMTDYFNFKDKIEKYLDLVEKRLNKNGI